MQSMETRQIISSRHLSLIINRLCFELIENHNDFENSVLIGLQPRGIYLLDRMIKQLNNLGGFNELKTGKLDITFYRDDFRRREQVVEASETVMKHQVEDRKVVLIDDVLYTGRTIRSGLDALMDFGRPRTVELLVLIDRRFSRHLPIQPDYVGRTVDAIASEHVEVDWGSNEGTVLLKSKEQ